jgi:hypothetical protein
MSAAVMHKLTGWDSWVMMDLSKPGGSRTQYLNLTTPNCIMTAYCPAVRVPGLDNRYARIDGVVGI